MSLYIVKKHVCLLKMGTKLPGPRMEQDADKKARTIDVIIVVSQSTKDKRTMIANKTNRILSARPTCRNPGSCPFALLSLRYLAIVVFAFISDNPWLGEGKLVVENIMANRIRATLSDLDIPADKQWPFRGTLGPPVLKETKVETVPCRKQDKDLSM